MVWGFGGKRVCVLCSACVCVFAWRGGVKVRESYLKVVSLTLWGVLSLIRTLLHMNDPLPTHHECTMHWRSSFPHTHIHTHKHCELIDSMRTLWQKMWFIMAVTAVLSSYITKQRISCNTVYCVTCSRLGNDVMMPLTLTNLTWQHQTDASRWQFRNRYGHTLRTYYCVVCIPM